MPRSKYFGYAASGLVICAALLYTRMFSLCDVGQINDDAMYIIGAQSLMQGHYVALDQPIHSPLPLYPPGFPLFLVPFVALIGTHWSLLNSSPSFFYSSTVFCCGVWRAHGWIPAPVSSSRPFFS